MNRWFFWVLAPIMLATAIGLPYLTEPPTWQGQLILYAICAALVLATLGLTDARRFRWALKGLAAAILSVYALYVLSEAWQWWGGKPFGFGSPRARANLMNAVGGFIAFGLPSIVFLIKGRSETEVDVLLSDEEPGADL
jgi:hypothetical protein